IRATPPTLAKSRSPGTPGHFDRALVGSLLLLFPCSLSLVSGLRIAQIRAIFALPPQYGKYPHPLAYIQWFTGFNQPDNYT
ncbi:hypothetical protein B0H13DRAFT_1515779, partial [Mycena leptocephala]